MRAPVSFAAPLLACVASGWLSGCSWLSPIPTPPMPDADQASRTVMQALVPQLIGTWRLRQVAVSFQPSSYYHAQVPLRGDTVFQDLATLTLVPATVPHQVPPDTRYPELEGQLQFRGQSYPVVLALRVHPEQLTQHAGPQALFLLETNFPPGSRSRDAGETWLTNLGLLGDTYSLELEAGQPLMHWRGLTRGVRRIDLVK